MPTYITGEDIRHRMTIFEKGLKELRTTLDFIRNEIGEESISYELVNKRFLETQEELSEFKKQKFIFRSAEIESTVTAREVYNLIDSTENIVIELNEAVDELYKHFDDDHVSVIILEREYRKTTEKLEKLKLRQYPIEED